MNKNVFTGLVLSVVILGVIFFYISKSDESERNKRQGVIAEDFFAASMPIPTPTPTSTSTSSPKESVKGVENNVQEDNLVNNKNLIHMITVETNYGKIVFETYDKDAPKTVENFITLANKGFYTDVIFHRVISGFMIQGGDPTGTGKGGPGYKFEDELNSSAESYKNGYKKGVVAMANSGPNTNGSQFFIMLADNPLPNLYTIFGKVVSGQEVVDKIGGVATDGDDRPLENVIIKKVTITKI